MLQTLRLVLWEAPQVGGSEVMRAGLVDLDGTWFVQIALFLLLYAMLRYLFFQPYVTKLRQRDEATKGRRAEAARLTEEAARLEASVGSRLAAAKAEAMVIRRKLAEEGERLKEEILTRERARVQEKVTREVAALDRQKTEILANLDPVARQMADMIEAQVRLPEAS